MKVYQIIDRRWRQVASVTLLLIGSAQLSFACSVAIGEDGTEVPTSSRVSVALAIFVLGLLVAAAHAVVFVYRGGRNAWVFWVTAALSFIITPFSLLFMMAAAGTACGNGTIEIAGFTLAFQVIALAAQVISWKRPDRSYTLTIPRG